VRHAPGFMGKIEEKGAYPVACWRPRKPSATRSFCIASTSRPVAPSYKSRVLPRFPPVGEYCDERGLRDDDHVLGVLLGPEAAARVGRETRRETTALRCNGAMPPDRNDALGSLRIIALLEPVKTGAAVNDAILKVSSPSRLGQSYATRFCTERRASLPLLRAGLLHICCAMRSNNNGLEKRKQDDFSEAVFERLRTVTQEHDGLNDSRPPWRIKRR
jgi:hypothetical protein